MEMPDRHLAVPQSGFTPGMTLREYFAAAALTGALSNQTLLAMIDENAGIAISTRDAAAHFAFAVADAMLAEREKQTP